LQQIVVEGPVGPPHVWLLRLQQPQEAQSESVAHEIAPDGIVVLVVELVAAVDVVVVSAADVVVVGTGEVADPQQTTWPVSRHVLRQHFFRLRLQDRAARRRQNFCRLAGQVARRGSVWTHSAISAGHWVRQARQAFGVCGAAATMSGSRISSAVTSPIER
jgi:hypothetical protein